MAFLGGSGSGMMKSYESNRSLLKEESLLMIFEKRHPSKSKKDKKSCIKKPILTNSTY